MERHGGQLQHEAEHTRPRKRHTILSYLLILFAAAFLLLLMSYFMQRRQNAEAASDALKQSASAAETLKLMQEENTALKAQTTTLEEQVKALTLELEEQKSLNAQLDSASQAQSTDLKKLARQAEAMQWFWQIDDYYARNYRSVARQLIEKFEALGLKDSLPTENTTDTNRFSPAARYQEIYDDLS